METHGPQLRGNSASEQQTGLEADVSAPQPRVGRLLGCPFLSTVCNLPSPGNGMTGKWRQSREETPDQEGTEVPVSQPSAWDARVGGNVCLSLERREDEPISPG